MDFELARTLTHSVMKALLAQAQQNPGNDSQFRQDMQFGSIFSRVEGLAWQEGHVPATNQLSGQERSYVSQSLWELVVQGILVPTADGGTQGWPFVSFTEHGKTAINSESPTPYDPTAYLMDFADADPVVGFYIEEALRCFRANCHSACVVMLGVASERLFDLLLEHFIDALASDRERENLEKRTDGKFVTVRYDEFKKRLDPKKGQLPLPMRDNLDTALTSIFNLIRQHRNDSGHPTGRVISRNEAYALLNVFPHYYGEMATLTGYLGERPNSLS